MAGISFSFCSSLSFSFGLNFEFFFEALTTLYDSTRGKHWINKKNWLRGDPCLNSWYGVSCNATNEIVESLFFFSFLKREERERRKKNECKGEREEKKERFSFSFSFLFVFRQLGLNSLIGCLPNEIGGLSYLTLMFSFFQFPLFLPLPLSSNFFFEKKGH